MMPAVHTADRHESALQRQNTELRARLEEAEQALRAIRSG